MSYNIIISQHLFVIWTRPCHLFPPCAAFFFSCLYSKGGVYGLWMLPISLEERGPRSTYGTQHTGPHFWLSYLLTQLLSGWNDLIPGVVNISEHTYTYTHTKGTWRHTSHVCLFLLNVVKCCLDTAWYWLWWNKSALALLLLPDLWWFIQRLPHRMLQSVRFLAISCCCELPKQVF